jgi:DHA2 family multidrug resistance protein-like MFS transporter
MAFYLQLVRGYSPLQSGLLYLPFAGAQLIFAPRSAVYVRRFGPKVVCAVGLAIAGAAIGGYTLLGAHSPIWVLAVLFFFQGVGMANVMPPATESIMASLPREKAGVGSAIGNTIRQVAGALGIAILGSLLSAIYRSKISDHLTAIPAGSRSDAGNSISSTYAAASQHTPAVAGQIMDASNAAFITAMHWASVGAAISAVIGIVIVVLYLPTKAALAAAAGGSTPNPTKSEPESELETLGEQFELADSGR